MSEVPLPSLLAESDRQGALFLLPASYEEKLDQAGQYTAERLFSRDPEKYKAVAAMLSAGRGVRAIKRACAVHHDTIHAVAARERIAIDTLKERIVKDLETAIQVGAERVVEVMESMEGEKLPLALGILIDKLQLLTGGATMRLETSDVTPTTREPATFGDWLETLKRANAPQTGLGEGGKGQIAAAGEVVHRLPAPGGVELLTDGSSLGGQRELVAATVQATGASAGEASFDQGEGGVAKPGGEPARPTHSRGRNFRPIDPLGASPDADASSADAGTPHHP